MMVMIPYLLMLKKSMALGSIYQRIITIPRFHQQRLLQNQYLVSISEIHVQLKINFKRLIRNIYLIIQQNTNHQNRLHPNMGSNRAQRCNRMMHNNTDDLMDLFL
jgi:hypothetical protein